jgi:uncharacterized membrane protein
MAKHKYNRDAGFISPRLLLVVRCLTLIAFGVSAYLAYIAFTGSGVAGCGPDSGCDKVLQSRWSKWFGVPVSVFALLVYGALFALTFKLDKKTTPLAQRETWKFLIPISVLIIASVLWFAALQVFVIKQTCPFCMTVHAAGLIAAALLLWAAPIRNAPEKTWQAEKQVFIPPALVRRTVAIAVVAFAVFGAGQLLYRPRTFTQTTVASSGVTNKAARVFQIYNGMFKLDLDSVPVIGDSHAPQTIVSLFDYTCHHCRIMHWHLMEAHRTLSNELAIVSLPMPLDNHCNYTVRQTPAPHTNACEYAKLGLAVWRADREKQHLFDDWIFTPEKPPALPEAQQFAAKLVGSSQLAKALQDPWLPQQLMQGINIYATNYIHLGNGSMPQLIIGSQLTSRTFENVNELYRILQEQLGLRLNFAQPPFSPPQPRPPNSG